MNFIALRLKLHNASKIALRQFLFLGKYKSDGASKNRAFLFFQFSLSVRF